MSHELRPASLAQTVLVGERGTFRVGPRAWRALLDLARRSGWTPRGTLRGAGWSGAYAPPCCQMVCARDAAELALAIEDLLDDIPDHEPPQGAPCASRLERFAGRAKPHVAALADFLRGGAVVLFAGCGDRGDRAELV